MIRRAASAAFNALFPLRCAGCGRFDVVLCPECAARLTNATGPARCAFCAAAWEDDGNCPRCFRMHELEGIRAAFEMEGAARQLVHALKYRYYRAAAPRMAEMMSRLNAELAIDRYFAVPLHRSRLKERGFNQSALLLERTGWQPSAKGLTRVRRTDRQVGQAFGERRSNVTDAFAYSGPRLDGLTVALVDDVVTTGATVTECANVLKDAGARAVWAFAFARASYRWDSSDVIDD